MLLPPLGFRLQSLSHPNSRDRLRPSPHLTLRRLPATRLARGCPTAVSSATPRSRASLTVAPPPNPRFFGCERRLLGLAPFERPFSAARCLAPPGADALLAFSSSKARHLTGLPLSSPLAHRSRRRMSREASPPDVSARTPPPSGSCDLRNQMPLPNRSEARVISLHGVSHRAKHPKATWEVSTLAKWFGLLSKPAPRSVCTPPSSPASTGIFDFVTKKSPIASGADPNRHTIALFGHRHLHIDVLLRDLGDPLGVWGERRGRELAAARQGQRHHQDVRCRGSNLCP